MQYVLFTLTALCLTTSIRCLKPDDVQQKHSCLLQVQQHSQPLQSRSQGFGNDAGSSDNDYADLKAQLHKRSKFTPVWGSGGTLKASLEGVCEEDAYSPSLLEQQFYNHSAEWTSDKGALCEHLPNRDTWIQENREGKMTSGDQIFSRMCLKGKAPQLVEPLAGILRDPRMICDGWWVNVFFGIDWLVLADQNIAPPPKKIFFDAGGTRFMDAMRFFTGSYELRGLELDEIYVWEAEHQGTEAYWDGTPPAARRKWEPRLTFYDGIPIDADPNSNHNPVKRILDACKPEDFCSFKLDIDTPSVELPIVESLLAQPEVAKVLDEFFFEHHVKGLMQGFGWYDVNGTFTDSYRIFTQLRKMGIRAHSWV